MTVVSANVVALIRCRKMLEKAFQRKNWEHIRQWDISLGESLNAAFEEQPLDANTLIEELERVLSLYADIVAAVPAEADSLAMRSLLAFSSAPSND